MTAQAPANVPEWAKDAPPAPSRVTYAQHDPDGLPQSAKCDRVFDRHVAPLQKGHPHALYPAGLTYPLDHHVKNWGCLPLRKIDKLIKKFSD